MDRKNIWRNKWKLAKFDKSKKLHIQDSKGFKKNKYKDIHTKTHYNQPTMKVAREKYFMYTGSSIRLIPNFSSEIIKVRRQLDYILRVLKEKIPENKQNKKLSFKTERKIKILQDKQKLK